MPKVQAYVQATGAWFDLLSYQVETPLGQTSVEVRRGGFVSTSK